MKTKGLILITIGVLCLLSALGLVAYNTYEDYQASLAAHSTLDQIVDYIDELQNDTSEGNSQTIPDSDTSAPEIAPPAHEPVIPDYILNPEIEMPSVKIDGEYYIGVLEIPKLQLALPINSTLSMRRLRSTPCRYNGSAYTQDLVIAAHNYNSHFGNLKQLEHGDLLYFTDMSGNRFTYKVDVIETLIPTAVEEMVNGEWALSLFTCTPGGANRVTLRCDIVNE